MAAKNGTKPEADPPWDDILRQVGEHSITRLSSGVVLRSKRIPHGILRRIATQTPTPPVPVVTLDDGREEPNPNDPDYQESLLLTYTKRIRDLQKTIFALGTERWSLPTDFPEPNDLRWSAPLEELGVDVAPVTDPVTRYYHWLTMTAIVDQMDETRAFAVGQFMQGAHEYEVTEAMEFFRRLSRERADRGVPAQEAAPDGDSVRADTPGDGVAV